MSAIIRSSSAIKTLAMPFSSNRSSWPQTYGTSNRGVRFGYYLDEGQEPEESDARAPGTRLSPGRQQRVFDRIGFDSTSRNTRRISFSPPRWRVPARGGRP